MTSGVPSFSTVLIWNYDKIIELASISGPSESMDTIDLTSHDSPDTFKEFVAGPRDGGEVSFEGSFIKEDSIGQITLHTDIQGGTKRNCFMVMPMSVGGCLFFAALGTGFETSYPHDGKIGVSGTLKITGKPTLFVTQSAGMSGLTGIEQEIGASLSITPSIAVGTYAYACTVDTASTWVKLTAVAAAHTVYIQGVLEATTVESDEIALGDAGTTTDVLIIVYETASSLTKSPRLYILTVTRP